MPTPWQMNKRRRKNKLIERGRERDKEGDRERERESGKEQYRTDTTVGRKENKIREARRE